MSHDQDHHFHLKPVLDGILRTCLHPKRLVLRLESVVHRASDSHGGGAFSYGPSRDGLATPRTARLFLTDGELLIQAVLSPQIADSFTTQDLQAGRFVEVKGFDVKKARRRHGRGWIVYLDLKDCVIRRQQHADSRVSGAAEPVDVIASGAETRRAHEDWQDTAGGFVRDEDEDEDDDDDDDDGSIPRPGSPDRGPFADVKRKAESVTSSDDDDAFETKLIDLQVAKRRRQTLVEFSSQHDTGVDRSTLDQPAPAAPQSSSYADRVSKKKVTFALDPGRDEHPTFDVEVDRTAEILGPPFPRHRDTAGHLTSLEPPLHSLASLVHRSPGHSLPRKNYTLNTFAVVTYVGGSVISRPGSAFPPKRNIKIEDPSLHLNLQHRGGRPSNNSNTGVGVTVAVYRDALNFKPAVGTIALLRGLVMQRLPNRDVILNKYAAATSSKITKRGKVVVVDGDGGLARRRLQHRQRRRPDDAGHVVDGAVPEAGDEVRADEDVEAGEEEYSPVVLGDDDWFITSPSLLHGLGFDVPALQAWWEQTRRT